MRSLTGHKEGPGRQVSEFRQSTLTERDSQRPSAAGSEGGGLASTEAAPRISLEASLVAVPETATFRECGPPSTGDAPGAAPLAEDPARLYC